VLTQADIAKQAQAGDIAVSVDGKVLKKAQLETDVKALMKVYKDKIPKIKPKKLKLILKSNFWKISSSARFWKMK